VPYAPGLAAPFAMTADVVPIIGAMSTPALPAPSSVTPVNPADPIDLILAGRHTEVTADGVPLAPGEILHPLESVETVEGAAEVIGRMLVEDRNTKGTRVYPRRILRQQHIAAYMLVNPFATTTEICAFFNIGAGSLTNICKSDTFKALIDRHRISIETSLGSDLTEQLRQTLQVSIDVVQKSVITQQDPDFALAVLDKTANRLGLGAKHNTNVQINNNIVTPEMIAMARARKLNGGS